MTLTASDGAGRVQSGWCRWGYAARQLGAGDGPTPPSTRVTPPLLPPWLGRDISAGWPPRPHGAGARPTVQTHPSGVRAPGPPSPGGVVEQRRVAAARNESPLSPPPASGRCGSGAGVPTAAPPRRATARTRRPARLRACAGAGSTHPVTSRARPPAHPRRAHRGAAVAARRRRVRNGRGSGGGRAGTVVDGRRGLTDPSGRACARRAAAHPPRRRCAGSAAAARAGCRRAARRPPRWRCRQLRRPRRRAA